MGACPNGKLSLAVRPGDETKPAFTAEELLELGREYARVENIGGDLREDAAQEFAVAAWQALTEAEHGENLRAFQIRAGKWAVANFLRGEYRCREHEDAFREERFRLQEKNDDLSPETVMDESAEDPLPALINREDGARAMALLRQLPELERKVVVGIVLEGGTQRELATALGVNQRQVSRLLHRALQKIRKKFV
jgi:RNA polymerase sigma factor (sigma-70 family)